MSCCLMHFSQMSSITRRHFSKASTSTSRGFSFTSITICETGDTLVVPFHTTKQLLHKQKNEPSIQVNIAPHDLWTNHVCCWVLSPPSSPFWARKHPGGSGATKDFTTVFFFFPTSSSCAPEDLETLLPLTLLPPRHLVSVRGLSICSLCAARWFFLSSRVGSDRRWQTRREEFGSAELKWPNNPLFY